MRPLRHLVAIIVLLPAIMFWLIAITAEKLSTVADYLCRVASRPFVRLHDKVSPAGYEVEEIPSSPPIDKKLRKAKA